jgi:protein-tyrosine-phosphatase
MDKTPIIIFVCEHGAAKSIIAAAYFNQLANQEGLALRAFARGTNPDQELSAQTVNGLSKDGLSPTEFAPQQLSLQDIQSAQRIVSFCALPSEYHEKITVEDWEGIPPVSQSYEKARDKIIERLNFLIASIRSSP